LPVYLALVAVFDREEVAEERGVELAESPRGHGLDLFVLAQITCLESGVDSGEERCASRGIRHAETAACDLHQSRR
jgi:hypothetical protein